MAHFSYDGDVLVEDENGDVSYDEALQGAVQDAVASITMTLWGLVDEIEYIVAAETVEPTNIE